MPGQASSSPTGQARGPGAPGHISLDFSHPPGRRGPRDGWNGMTLRLLRVIVREGAISTRELARIFGITRRAVNYHVRKLAAWGLVERVARSRHDPHQVVRALVRPPEFLPDPPGAPSGHVAKRPPARPFRDRPGPGAYTCGAESEGRTARPGGNKENGAMVAGFAPPPERRPAKPEDRGSPHRGVSGGPADPYKPCRRAPVETRALALWCFMSAARQALTSEQAARLMGVSVRTARRVFRWLLDRGLVVRAGGRRCPWGFFVPVEPGVLAGPVEHRHASRAVGHRYRLRSWRLHVWG